MMALSLPKHDTVTRLPLPRDASIMGSSGSIPNVTSEDTRSVFSQLEEPCAPLSATAVAEKLDCPDGTAQQHLEAINDWG